MHRHDRSTEVLTQAVVRYAVERMHMDPPPLDKARPAAELRAMVGQTVTATGIGGLEALRIFADVLGPASISIDHPRFLSFVPAAPTEASILFDLVVGRVEHLRRLVARGRRSRLRRERGAALHRRPRRASRDGRRSVRHRRHRRQPQRADRCPIPVACTAPIGRTIARVGCC